MLAWQAGKAALAQLTWFDRRGRVLGTAGPAADISDLRLSRDAKHILFGSGGSFFTGLVESHQSGYLDLAGVGEALWLPGSSHILYRSGNDIERLLDREAEGGAGKEVVRIPGSLKLMDVSPDGKILLYRVGWSVYSIRLGGHWDPRPAIEAQEMVYSARFSPDGRWFVYSVRDANRYEIYAQPFASGGLRTQISSGGGEEPNWRGDGKEILYRKGKKIYSVSVNAKGGEIHAGAPEVLFEVAVPDTLNSSSDPLAVTSDGSAILFAQGVKQPDPPVSYDTRRIQATSATVRYAVGWGLLIEYAQNDSRWHTGAEFLVNNSTEIS